MQGTAHRRQAAVAVNRLYHSASGDLKYSERCTDVPSPEPWIVTRAIPVLDSACCSTPMRSAQRHRPESPPPLAPSVAPPQLTMPAAEYHFVRRPSTRPVLPTRAGKPTGATHMTPDWLRFVSPFTARPWPLNVHDPFHRAQGPRNPFHETQEESFVSTLPRCAAM